MANRLSIARTSLSERSVLSLKAFFLRIESIGFKGGVIGGEINSIMNWLPFYYGVTVALAGKLSNLVWTDFAAFSDLSDMHFGMY